MPLKVLSIGGSRNIGYHASLRLLAKGNIVTFLLRKPDVFAADPAIQSYLKAGTARLIPGDALIKEDVARAWDEAAKGEGEQKVDVLLFTVGGVPSFSLLRGFIVSPPDLVTRCLLNSLRTLPSPSVHIVVVSTMGLTHASHSRLPLLWKPLYSYLLNQPHVDKQGMEKILAYCAGFPWNDNDGPPAKFLPEDWQNGLPSPGTLKDVVIIRAALFTDGDAQGDKSAQERKNKPAYKVQDENGGGYTISRKDVAHFIVEGVAPNWDGYKGRVVSVSY